MKVSVVMATYNGMPYIEDQIKSIVSQVTPPDEIIIFDDCSTDGTFEFVSQAVKLYDVKIEVFQQVCNVGYTRNFSSALEKATGDVIFLSDQDDVWMSQKISLMLEKLSESNKMIAICDAELVSEGLQSKHASKMSQLISMEGSLNNHIMGCCIAIERPFLQKILPIPHGFRGHDNWIMGIGKFLDLVLYIEEPLQLYRRHQSNTSNIKVNTVAPLGRLVAIESLLRGFFRVLRGQHDFACADAQRLILYKFLCALEGTSSFFPRDSRLKLLRLGNQVAFAQERSVARRMPFFKRALFVFKNLLAGRYEGKRGARNAVADFLAGRPN